MVAREVYLALAYRRLFKWWTYPKGNCNLLASGQRVGRWGNTNRELKKKGRRLRIEKGGGFVLAVRLLPGASTGVRKSSEKVVKMRVACEDIDVRKVRSE